MADISEMAKEVNETAEHIAAQSKAPAGYVEMRLSTHGKYNAPAVFNMRNFSIEEAFELGSIAQEDMPIKIPAMVQKLIYEEDVNILDFLEQEVTETMIRFYVSFYSSKLKNVKYELTDDDYEWVLKNVYNGVRDDNYNNWVVEARNGRIPSNFDIDLTKVEFYQIPADAKKLVTYKRGDFTVKFCLPKFGDSSLMQQAINEKFKEKDKKFATTYENYKANQEIENARRRGEIIANAAKHYIPDNELKACKAYELEKTSYYMGMMKGLYLYEIDGRKVYDEPLATKIELAKDPRIDYNCFQMVSEKFSKVEIGPIPKVRIEHPIKGCVTTIDYTFRTLELLAAIKDFRSDDSDIVFVEEDE